MVDYFGIVCQTVFGKTDSTGVKGLLSRIISPPQSTLLKYF